MADDVTGLVQQLLRATDIVGMARELGLEPRVEQSGLSWRYVCQCPMCGEERFGIDTVHQSYYCFGCGKNGDVIILLRTVTGCTFPEALLRLGQRAEIPCNVGNLL